jgi:hypothetical protein
MTGKELFNFYISTRAKAGSKDSTYAQLLLTLSLSLWDVLFNLLESAEKQGKRLDVVQMENIWADDISLEEIVFI